MAVLFCLTIFVSSCLLFLVQPMCAKMVLPLLGGTPAVWNTCMVFFQAGLLGGYAYSHYLPARIGLLRHGILHVAALALVFFTLPIVFVDYVPAGWHPVAWLLVLLVQTTALPFLLVAASGPLLQRWFAELPAARDPYFLYAASNLGSFAGLLCYPLLLEPAADLPAQADVWRWAYLGLIVLTALCLPFHSRGAPIPSHPSEPASGPSWRERGRWVVLALVPSSLMLSVTSHLTTDIAPIPLLWVIPLALYLLSFVVVFAGKPILTPPMVRRWVPMAVVVVLFVMLTEANDPLPLVLGLPLLAFFWLALACHGELAAGRPPASRLTEFYLCLAIGGVLGGMLNALVAPLIFSGLAEYPLMLVLAALLCGPNPLERPRIADFVWALVIGIGTCALVLVIQSNRIVKLEPGNFTILAMFVAPLLVCYAFQAYPWRFGLGLGAILLASSFYHGVHGTPVDRERSYFGVHRVADKDGLRRLIHGNTVHGEQFLDPAKRDRPLTYYHRTGPIGQVFRTLDGDPRLERVGLVGLGAGSLAAYSKPGQHWTFFEIDPVVIRIAEDPKLFTFLADAKGKVDVIEGDARLQLQQRTDRFGVVVIDAFGSDSIPVHLLTQEALRLDLQRLDEHGLLAFHISNKYLNLEPVLANLAAAEQPPLVCKIRRDLAAAPPPGSLNEGKMPSVWVLIARREEDIPATLTGWSVARGRPELRPWTDHYSNVLQVFQWSGDGEP